MRFLVLLLCFFTSVSARADYGIVPPYAGLYLSGGMDYTNTSENYDSDGALQPILIGGQNGKLTQYSFWAEAEYGFAQDWSFRLRSGITTAGITSDSTGLDLVSGTGLSDTTLGLKWAVVRGFPGLTLETFSRFPLYSVANPDATQLVVGDGSFDLGVNLHAMTRMDNIFLFFSPGFVFRSGGYATAVLLDGGLELKFGNLYSRLFAKAHISTGENLRDDTSRSIHDTPGSGNTYLRLSGSPTSYLVGLKFGARISPAYTMQLMLGQTLVGTRAPNYFTAGLAFSGRFDFYVPEVRRRTREVPLEGDASDS